MKKFVAALLLLVASHVGAAEVKALKPGLQKNGDVVVVLPAKIVQACKDNGGCTIINSVEFQTAVQQVIEDHKKEICDYKEAAK